MMKEKKYKIKDFPKINLFSIKLCTFIKRKDYQKLKKMEFFKIIPEEFWLLFLMIDPEKLNLEVKKNVYKTMT